MGVVCKLEGVVYCPGIDFRKVGNYVASKNRKRPCPKQVALFAYLSSPGAIIVGSAENRSKQAESDFAEDNQSGSEFEEQSSPLDAVTVSDGEFTNPEPAQPSTERYITECQHNNGTVEKHSGSTTIIINSQSESPDSVRVVSMATAMV